MFIVQVNDNDGILNKLVSIHRDRHKAQTSFLETCKARLSNWNEYTAADKEALLDLGYEKFGTGVVVLIDTDGFMSDDDIRDQLTGQPSGNMTVDEIIHEGEIALAPGMGVDEILELCGNNLDAACSWDIQGQVVFKGSDGKWYTITTESSIGECSNEFITDVLSEIEHI